VRAGNPSSRKSLGARLSGWQFLLTKAGVMSARKNISVVRSYKYEPDECVRALTILLKKPISNEGSPTPATLDNEAKESKNDCPVTEQYT
jgi:hypothetical protein